MNGTELADIPIDISIPRYEHPNFHGIITQRGGEAEFEKLRKQHDLEHATALKATPELGKIAVEQAKLDARRAEIDRRAALEMERIQAYRVLVKDLDRERDALQLGRERCAQLKGEIVGRTDYIHTCWGRPREHDVHGEGNLNHIAGCYASLEGYSKAVELFPVWETAQVAKIEQLQTEATAFAKANGINPGK